MISNGEHACIEKQNVIENHMGKMLIFFKKEDS